MKTDESIIDIEFLANIINKMYFQKPLQKIQNGKLKKYILSNLLKVYPIGKFTLPYIELIL